ncbi:uncharacterized protein LOC113566242 [Drosophila persimilis]|uniref:uncharacterized protein LOC113566242 n=1 Tax=Drosophila persimilis TaxID=7234 RepID=UPI000F08F16E|nr:uncharacterized protein LOC113566242 [Drosophila persimilis]
MSRLLAMMFFLCACLTLKKPPETLLSNYPRTNTAAQAGNRQPSSIKSCLPSQTGWIQARARALPRKALKVYLIIFVIGICICIWKWVLPALKNICRTQDTRIRIRVRTCKSIR